MPTTEKNGDSGQTPSMLVSLLVFGMMIGLILLSVFLFPEEVDAGPLQISMTLTTLFAVGVAYRYDFHGALISESITHSINSALGTIFILLAIGALIGSLNLAGTVPAFVYYGVAILNPKIFYITVFILCSILSILTDSSFTTIGAVGVAFVFLSKEILLGDEDAETVYGIEPEDADFPPSTCLPERAKKVRIWDGPSFVTNQIFS